MLRLPKAWVFQMGSGLEFGFLRFRVCMAYRPWILLGSGFLVKLALSSLKGPRTQILWFELPKPIRIMVWLWLLLPESIKFRRLGPEA